MTVSRHEAERIEVSFRGDDGFTVMTHGNKSDAFVGGHHMYLDADGAYLGLIIYNADRGSYLVYDPNGSPLDKRYKSAVGAVKRLYRIRQDSLSHAAADAPTPCDACGYDIEPTDDGAQSTEVADEVISTCGGCADELGTLVLDAKDGVLNRESPRGKRPAPVEYAGEYVNRNGERYNVTALHTGAYLLRKCHTGAGYTNITGADMKSWIASGWLSRAEDVDEDVDDGATTTEQVFDRLAVSLAVAAAPERELVVWCVNGCDIQTSSSTGKCEACRKPTPQESVEAALDRLAADLSLAGPVLDRLRKSIVADEPTFSAPDREPDLIKNYGEIVAAVTSPRMTGDYSRCRSCGVAIDYGRSYCGGGRCIGLASETSDATAMRRAYV